MLVLAVLVLAVLVLAVLPLVIAGSDSANDEYICMGSMWRVESCSMWFAFLRRFGITVMCERFVKSALGLTASLSYHAVYGSVHASF